MKPGEQFEIEALNYLQKHYSKFGVTFHHENTADATHSDIEVIKNGTSRFYIEVKDATAQSGQFVLLPNEKNKSFTFSPRNKSEENEMTKLIINYMNKDFDRFNNAGTAGEALLIDSSVFSNWITEHYIEKGVSFFITQKTAMIIFPIDKFNHYFDISATYRIKKSGSKEPSKKYLTEIMNILHNDENISDVSVKDKDGKKKLYVTAPSSLSKSQFKCGDYTYYLSPQESNLFEIRQLSNTYNMNVIFTIKVKADQDPEDLNRFIEALSI